MRKEASPHNHRHRHHNRTAHTHVPALIMLAPIRPRSQLRRLQAICPRDIACPLKRYYIPMRPPRLSQMRYPRNNNNNNLNLDLTITHGGQMLRYHMHTQLRIGSAADHWFSLTRCRTDTNGASARIVDLAIARATITITTTMRRIRAPHRSSHRSHLNIISALPSSSLSTPSRHHRSTNQPRSYLPRPIT